MTTLAAILASIIALAECGISTSPLGGYVPTANEGACNGGLMD